MILLGIDPGLGGAIAVFLGADMIAVHDMPVLVVERGGKAKRTIDLARLRVLLNRPESTVAWIERAGAMPQQGVSSMFAFGRAVGSIEGMLAALTIPVNYVAPQSWRKVLQVPPGKDGSRLRASQLLPTAADYWARRKDDGRAEAALIGLYGLSAMVSA